MNANTAGVDATDDNESVNKNTGLDANLNNNGSNTPSTTAKQKKPFFKKNVI